MLIPIIQASFNISGTLQQLLVECLNDLRRNKDGLDPLKYPSQILCLAQAIEFTENCEKAIKSATLPNFLNDTKDQLDSYTSVDLDHDETSNVLELKLKALILDTIHYGIENLLNLLLPKKTRTIHSMATANLNKSEDFVNS